MNQQAIIFDMDGTLLDTLYDIGAAANHALSTHGFPTHDLEAFRWFVGEGSATLITRALPPEHRAPGHIQSCLQAFFDYYSQHWSEATQPYSGIYDLLETLERKQIRMAVVSNKPHQFTNPMMTHYFNRFTFEPIWGQRDGIAKKPDPTQALQAAQIMGVAAENCIFLGDSAVDMQTAKSAGMLPIGAGWGFRPADELWQAGAAQVIAHPMDLQELDRVELTDSTR
jgi:phosphoglycolate phosphatase